MIAMNRIWLTLLPALLRMPVHTLTSVQYNASGIGHFPLLQDVKHGFSWGLGAGNMAFAYGDFQEILQRKRDFFHQAQIGAIENSIVISPQHSDGIVFVDQTLLFAQEQSDIGLEVCADAVFTSISELTITIFIADCLTSIVYGIDSSDKPFVGIIHTGWRGLDAQLPTKAIAACCDYYSVKPDTILMGITPFLAKNNSRLAHFDGFSNVQRLFPYFDTTDDGYLFDLGACALGQYTAAGISEKNIQMYAIDTFDEARKGNAFSHRYATENNALNGRFLVAVQCP